jgi:DNA ligase-1
MRREFLQLANTFSNQNIIGWYASEKIDGTRALSDGGVTRGMDTRDVPWASVNNPKTGEPKTKVKTKSTGLWSRYGNPIMAPDSFLDKLPAFPVDGELFAGRGNFQLCRSIVAGDEPDPRFDEVTFNIYGLPSIDKLWGSGEVKNANMHQFIELDKCSRLYKHQPCVTGFHQELAYLENNLVQDDQVKLHKQILIESQEQVDAFYNEVLDMGGEGLMFRHPRSAWTPKRVSTLLKYKPFSDAEAKVIGFVSGREGKTGNMLGTMGALVVEYNGMVFELGTGFTMTERVLHNDDRLKARRRPGAAIDTWSTPYFTVGELVTFKYRELTDDLIPKEARYWRKPV